jgi:DNA-binding NarL/FixJ family response regulator
MAEAAPGVIRILVADDHPVVRDGLVAVLSTQPDFRVVGEAGDGRQAVEKVQALQPDVLLLDLEMPEMDGVEVLEAISETHPLVHAIVFTAYDTDERILGAIQVGARGYLLKGAPRQEVFQAIRLAMRGESLLPPLVASRLIRQVQAEKRPPARGSDGSPLIGSGLHRSALPKSTLPKDRPRLPPGQGGGEAYVEPLTRREREVLLLVSQGKTNKEIAQVLVVTERTVKFHVSSILSKLGAANRTEALQTALRLHLIEL